MTGIYKNWIGRLSVVVLAMAAPVGYLGWEANLAAGQEPSEPPTAAQQTNGENAPTENTPLYRIEVVGREIPAINYFQHKGMTTVGMQGTGLLSDVHGDARVEALPGSTRVHVTLNHLAPANSFGPEYLTYVLWAITPEGRPVNLGEVLPGKKGKDEIAVTTNLEAFGLIVTAEPYFAVTMPSNLVVAENYVIHGKTKGEIEPVNVHYSLLPRGAYEQTAGRHTELHPITTSERSPLDLYEAENAVEIAEAGGADQYAADSMATAKRALDKAEHYDKYKHDRQQSITYAREAVQTAEDARIITIRKLKDADEAAQRQAQMQAQQTAQQEAMARSQAQQQQQQAEQAAEQARQQQQQAEQQTAAAQQQQLQAQQQAAAANQREQQAEQNARQLALQARQARERLRQQLNQVLQTRETASGLIMSMPDVLFAFDKYELKPDARVKLAKVSGILLAYPDLKVQVEGYTDNVGSPGYNQKLSEERADSVHDFLISQNVPAGSVTAQGHGENDPIADNSTKEGRSRNRRVELVVTGAAIGIEGAQNAPQTGGPAGTNGEHVPPQ